MLYVEKAWILIHLKHQLQIARIVKLKETDNSMPLVMSAEGIDNTGSHLGWRVPETICQMSERVALFEYKWETGEWNQIEYTRCI